MKKEFVTVNNLQIACYIKNHEHSKTIFFIHGNSCSSRVWYKQFAYPFLSDYRLIAFDIPGHGQSDAVENEEDYNLLFLGEIMAKAVNALAGNNEYILTGFSFGANVIAEMISHSLNPKGLAIISPTIVGGDYTLNHTLKTGADPTILFTDEPEQNEIKKIIHSLLLSVDEKDFSICLEDFNAVKKPFRSMILRTSIEGKLGNEILNIIQYSVPLLVIFGKEDKIINPNYLDNAALPLWNNTINKISNAGHFLVLDQPEVFNDLLTAYCKQIFK
jgi:pimeloyl-ACP methyl ester carboxylesterase